MEPAVGRARGRATGRGDGQPRPGTGTGEDIPAPRAGTAPRGGAASGNLKQRMERMKEMRAKRLNNIVIPYTKPENVSTTQGMVIFA